MASSIACVRIVAVICDPSSSAPAASRSALATTKTRRRVIERVSWSLPAASMGARVSAVTGCGLIPLHSRAWISTSSSSARPGSMPTAQRGPSALLVRRGGERLLFDCGEGTQRQLLRSTVGLVDLREVFLTHYHADHYLGLPGMLKTFALRGREVPITIYGPPGLERPLRRPEADLRQAHLRLRARGPAARRRACRATATPCDVFPVLHGVSAVGYALVEDERPGRFDVDDGGRARRPVRPGARRAPARRAGHARRRPRRHARRGARAGAPRPQGRRSPATPRPRRPWSRPRAAPTCSSTRRRSSRTSEERARETLHSTALDAAALAREADVGLLALTHLSSRYLGARGRAREARTVFPETVVPKDFDTIEVRFEERGGPRLVKGGALAAASPASVAEEEAVPVGEEGGPDEPHGASRPGGGRHRGRGAPGDPAAGRHRVVARDGRRAPSRARPRTPLRRCSSRSRRSSRRSSAIEAMTEPDEMAAD